MLILLFLFFDEQIDVFHSIKSMGFGDKIKALSPDIFIEIHQKLLICGDIIQPEAHHHIQLPLFDSFHQEMEVGAVKGFGTVLTKIRVMLAAPRP